MRFGRAVAICGCHHLGSCVSLGLRFRGSLENSDRWVRQELNCLVLTPLSTTPSVALSSLVQGLDPRDGRQKKAICLLTPASALLPRHNVWDKEAIVWLRARLAALAW